MCLNCSTHHIIPYSKHGFKPVDKTIAKDVSKDREHAFGLLEPLQKHLLEVKVLNGEEEVVDPRLSKVDTYPIRPFGYHPYPNDHLSPFERAR